MVPWKKIENFPFFPEELSRNWIKKIQIAVHTYTQRNSEEIGADENFRFSLFYLGGGPLEDD